MCNKRTYASVTSNPCECGYLQYYAANPYSPIAFDKKTQEFQFVYMEEGCAGKSVLVIYHCPFCGGAAPESRRDQLFEAIPQAEEERLAEILGPVRTMDDAISHRADHVRANPICHLTDIDPTFGQFRDRVEFFVIRCDKILAVK